MRSYSPKPHKKEHELSRSNYWFSITRIVVVFKIFIILLSCFCQKPQKGRIFIDLCLTWNWRFVFSRFLLPKQSSFLKELSQVGHCKVPGSISLSLSLFPPSHSMHIDINFLPVFFFFTFFLQGLILDFLSQIYVMCIISTPHTKDIFILITNKT